MEIQLRDYGEFADSIGLSATKKNGVFKYFHKPTGIEISPFELGELYRLFLEQYIKGVQDTINQFEGACMAKDVKMNTLPAVFKDELDHQKIYVQTLKNRLK